MKLKEVVGLIISVLIINTVTFAGLSPKTFTDPGSFKDDVIDSYGDLYNKFLETGIIDEDDLENMKGWIPGEPVYNEFTANLEVYPDDEVVFETEKEIPIVMRNTAVEPVVITKIELDGEDKDKFEIRDNICDSQVLGRFSNRTTCYISVAVKGDKHAEADVKVLYNAVNVKKIHLVNNRSENTGCSMAVSGLPLPLYLAIPFFLFIRRLFRKQA